MYSLVTVVVLFLSGYLCAAVHYSFFVNENENDENVWHICWCDESETTGKRTQYMKEAEEKVTWWKFPTQFGIVWKVLCSHEYCQSPMPAVCLSATYLLLKWLFWFQSVVSFWINLLNV